MKSKSILFGIILSLIFAACGDEDEATKSVDCNEFPTEIQDEAEKIADAATTYATDPSSANCNAYVDALDAYLAAVDPFVEKCGDDESFAQWKSAIDQYETVKSQISASCGS